MRLSIGILTCTIESVVYVVKCSVIFFVVSLNFGSYRKLIGQPNCPRRCGSQRYVYSLVEVDRVLQCLSLFTTLNVGETWRGLETLMEKERVYS